MKKYISKLHYLTQDLPNRSHADQAHVACGAGANWIQYRCMTKTDDELVAEMKAQVPIDIPSIFISSVAQRNIDGLKDLLWKEINSQ